MAKQRMRIDVLLVERGLAPTREKAKALLMAGEVIVRNQPVTKAGTLVDVESVVSVKEQPQFVGRGGEKMAGALDNLLINPSGMVVLDVGASTGGFTDCLLQRGAIRSYALDVGRGQIHNKLVQDPRVVVIEGVNARNPFYLPDQVDMAVADVSFISLRLVVPEMVKHLKPGGHLLLLVKPQFEAERGEVGRGGVVRDGFVHARVLGRFTTWAIKQGYRLRGVTISPLVGDAGNKEFFVFLQPQSEVDPEPKLTRL
ncbi:MAG: TlyA family RNA methyltransferase [Chloroflexota bacterium]|nr:TlyA family RNA methyltransferase [Chloroflexota bacterium]